MTRILIFSDIHIHAHKGKPERLEDCLKVLDWVIETAQDQNIQHVIFGGDLFQERQKIQVYAYHETWKRMKGAMPFMRFYLLLGNHDLWYFDKTDISSVNPLGSLLNVQVIDKPSTVTIGGLDIDFLPFTHDPISVIQDNFQQKSPVLIGHIAVNGAILNFHHKTKAEVSVENENDMTVVGSDILAGWQKVFLGHYHGAQKLNDSVEYIGSPLQLTFNEAFQEKNIIILDTDDLSIEYVVNNFSPKHLILKPDEVENYDLANNFVRIYTDDLSQTILADIKSSALEKYPSANITFLQEKPAAKDDISKKFNLTEGDILERYVETIGPENLDRLKLLRLGKEICSAY